MLISFVIPTRNRQWLARRAISSCFASNDSNIEVVVLDNSDDPLALSESIAGNTRLSIHSSNRKLAMHENWERGLSLASGDYVAYLSDKDFLLPQSLPKLRTLISNLGNPDLIAYRKVWFDEPACKLLHFQPTGLMTPHSTNDFLKSWFDVPRHLHNMPSIYGGFASKTLIQKVKRDKPHFFVGNAPDVASAVVLCAHTPQYYQWDYQAVVAHGGEWSTGAPAMKFGMFSEKAKDFLSLYGVPISERLGLPGVLATTIAEVLLLAQESHPKELDKYAINWNKFLPHLRKELDRLQIPSKAKRAEWRRLRSPQSIAPRSAVRMHSMRCVKEFLYQRVSPLLSPLKNLEKLIRSVKKPNEVVSNRYADMPWDGYHQRFVTNVKGFEEAIEVASKQNPR